MPKKVLTGKIVSTKMQNTCIVSVDVSKKHPLYKKIIKSTKRYHAHYDIPVKNDDTVLIEECKPYSKHTTWKVLSVVKEDK